ncbi:DUF3106 domain-containing protein [Massilia aurea]|uniref:DUF3106 domain-containing protein n=1 Tax=Massilia aurea TaxID=373040 RepID=UPI0034637BE7
MSKKNVSTSRFPVLGTVIGVLAAAAIAWVIVDRFETPAILPAATETIASVRPLQKALDKPLWRDLSNVQQVALAPLEPEWDRMEGPRKRRWIEVSARFASMEPAEQQRVHERMRQWMKLTPQQRTLARENFNKTNKLAQGDKAANWENYKQLSPDQKRKLANKPSNTHKNAPVALPEAPQLVVPMPCPPNTTRRGAECVQIGVPDASAIAVMPAPVAPAPSAVTPAVAPVSPAPANGGAIATPSGQPSAAQAANAGN